MSPIKLFEAKKVRCHYDAEKKFGISQLLKSFRF